MDLQWDADETEDRIDRLGDDLDEITDKESFVVGGLRTQIATAQPKLGAVQTAIGLVASSGRAIVSVAEGRYAPRPSFQYR